MRGREKTRDPNHFRVKEKNQNIIAFKSLSFRVCEKPEQKRWICLPSRSFLDFGREEGGGQGRGVGSFVFVWVAPTPPTTSVCDHILSLSFI